MRFIIIASIIILFGGCTADVVAPAVHPFKPYYFSYPDSANVNVDGIDIIKYIHAQSVLDSLLYMNLTSSINNGALYYPIEIGAIPLNSGRYTIHKLNGTDSVTVADYSVTCCYDEPDQVNSIYDVYEPDSSQNYIQVLINKPARKFSAAFNAAFVNKYSPYDTVHMRCDMLQSRW